MYPDFYHLLKSLFGIEIPVLSLFKTFGFLVAMAFFAGGYVIYSELKRKEQLGIIGFTIDEITTGKKASIFDYLIASIIGFLVGYKFIGMLINWKEASPDPLSYMFSNHGNLMIGLLLAVAAVVYKFIENKKSSAEGIVVKKVKTYPHTRVGDIAVIAAIGGFTGAKIFNALETWDSFIQDPMGSLLSSSGLTFYGGLIVATFALWYYARKIKLDFRHLCDAAAPALILAYGIGRLGCQISGDGDWGIYNAAYTTDQHYKVVPTTQTFEQQALQYKDHINSHFKANESVPHSYFKAPSILPIWMVAYNYPHNVNNVGIEMKDCQDNYCSVLPIPVFPTPLYELLMGLLIFFILWKLRKRFDIPLSIFSIYLILNGIERFLIEQIRVNSTYNWGWLQPTQAEIIAVCISLCGVLLFVFRKKIDTLLPKTIINQ
ncbi:MAG: prolipoprotein diacylglyceryl transferase [Bacteroidetes bacterium]|nr:prolipoprotein diacylglyceryl transferase [Bacteroidota bacterium]